jgi:hypothetical protein
MTGRGNSLFKPKKTKKTEEELRAEDLAFEAASRAMTIQAIDEKRANALQNRLLKKVDPIKPPYKKKASKPSKLSAVDESTGKGLKKGEVITEKDLFTNPKGTFETVLDPVGKALGNAGSEVGKFFGMGVKKSSKWIDHIKDYQSKHGVSYKVAMQQAAKTYKK